jgi:hypothetical protein
MTKHTPGPWHYREGRNGEFIITCESGGFAPLARVKGDKRSTLKNAKANACLMAAATDADQNALAKQWQILAARAANLAEKINDKGSR